MMPYPTVSGPRFQLAIMLALVIFNTAYAATGDELVVTGSIVNLRAEPSLESRVLLRVAEGRTLIEISRYRDWLEVATRRSDVGAGWIHESLLSPVSGHTVDPGFAAFQQELNRINTIHTADTGEMPFLHVEQLAPGELRITAAAPWFALEQSQRETILSDLFSFWQQQNDVGNIVSLEVVDQNRQPHMLMFQ